jgi:pyruvate dehydrogenase E1 component
MLPHLSNKDQPARVERDPGEVAEWIESLDAVAETGGPEVVRDLLRALNWRAQQLEIARPDLTGTQYLNSIPTTAQGAYPGDEVLEDRLTALVRWNALAMVVRANQAHGELGGHLSSFASAAEIFEMGFNHFFRGPNAVPRGDLLFLQPHSAPGVYARAFLEGRLSEAQLDRFRQEVGGGGLSSYPHPWLMPDFWQFPTGSMGLGPIMSIHQARFMRYLENRGLMPATGRHVWGVFGDGEMDEPESTAGLSLAARECLDNLTFIINCNFQRLDGPVRGNGQIIQELERLFAGAGWNVIKVVWGSEWDSLFERDREGALARRFDLMPDGELQTLGANDGAYNLEHFFHSDPALQNLVRDMTEGEINRLRRGGHDSRKLHSAFTAALNHRGRPSAILAATKKGFGMGRAGESRMTAHQQKKLDLEALRAFRDRFHLPLSDDDLVAMRFHRPAADDPALAYLKQRREALGGSIPVRNGSAAPVKVADLRTCGGFALNAAGKPMSTTVAAIRWMGNLLKDPDIGPRLVPIVADEARTFGMANLFRQAGIYSPVGQLYEPEDAGSLLFYREASDGQILEEGITEAGAMAAWIAAATAYSVHGMPMLPLYIFYSMFGFQRVGDLIWAAADQRARGFLLGATSGRTTLGGEGLQHQDGSSHVIASTVPNCRSYDPAFASELAVILEHGSRSMLEGQEDVFYYITLNNEVYSQPSLVPGHEQDIVRGMHLHSRHGSSDAGLHVHLLASGAIVNEAMKAAELLDADWGVSSKLWSVTSFTELERDARECERWSRLHPAAPVRKSFVASKISDGAPVIAASDYVRAYPLLIASHVPGLVVLGTDGFGRSDTREALRRFFEVDRYHIAVAALSALSQGSGLASSDVAKAIARYGISAEADLPWAT